MKYEWIDEYLLKMPGVTKDLQKDWNWIRYQIGGKLFAAICLDDDWNLWREIFGGSGMRT